MALTEHDARAPEASRLTDGERLGLRRLTITTSIGAMVVRAGREVGAPATIMIHGAAGSWSTWTPLIRESDRRGTPLTDVIAVDLPGWGESRLPQKTIGVSELGDAVQEVAHALGYSSWTVIGHSLGGFVALDIAARAPAATLAVDLVSASGPAVLDGIRHPLRGGVRLPWFAGMLLAMRMLAPLGRAGRALVRFLHERGLLDALSSPLWFDRAALDPSVIEALSREVRPRAFAAAARAAAAYDVQAWRAIACPVRSVRGERDVFVGSRDAEEFGRLIPDFRSTMIAGAGHFASVEQPATVLDFFRG